MTRYNATVLSIRRILNSSSLRSHVLLPVPPRLAAISLSSRRAIMSDPNILSFTSPARYLFKTPVERYEEMRSTACGAFLSLLSYSAIEFDV